MPEAGRIASVAVNRANHSTLENSYHGKWKYFGNFVGNSQTAKSFLMREFLEHIFEIFFYKFLFDDLEIFVSFVFSFFFCESLGDRVLEILWNFSLGSETFSLHQNSC